MTILVSKVVELFNELERVVRFMKRVDYYDPVGYPGVIVSGCFVRHCKVSCVYSTWDQVDEAIRKL